jgi:hypothetical protein
MDPQLVDLARTAGTTVVTLMATDSWNTARAGLVALWRRVHPERAEQLADQLDVTRGELVAAREAGDQLTEGELNAEWQSRLRRLLAAEPALAEELRRFVEEYAPAAGQPADGISMHATASGHGRVYQAGRDQHITEG